MFLEHTDKITGIKFSHINDALMISSGLDKRLNFQDTKQLKVVKNWNQSEPISSFDFFHDGLHILYSTIQGTVHLMDLRQSDTPLLVFKGQQDKQVNSVAFSVKRKKKEVNEEMPNRNQVNVKDSFGLGEDKTEIAKIDYSNKNIKNQLGNINVNINANINSNNNVNPIVNPSIKIPKNNETTNSFNFQKDLEIKKDN